MAILESLGVGNIGDFGATGVKILYYIVMGILALIFIGMCAGGAYLYGVWKRYGKYKIVIFDRRKNKAGQETLFWCGQDKAGIFYDKKLKKRFFRLQKNRVDMSPQIDKVEGIDTIDIPSIPNLKGGEVVFLEKLAPKKYVFLDPITVEGRINLRITNEDTAEALREYDMNLKVIGNQNKALIIAMTIIAITGVVIGLMWMMQGKQMSEVAQIFKEMLPTLHELVKARGAAVASTVPG